MRKLLVGLITVVALLALVSVAAANPIFMPGISKDAQALRWAVINAQEASIKRDRSVSGAGFLFGAFLWQCYPFH